jgi:hypothetical protein
MISNGNIAVEITFPGDGAKKGDGDFSIIETEEEEVGIACQTNI